MLNEREDAEGMSPAAIDNARPDGAAPPDNPAAALPPDGPVTQAPADPDDAALAAALAEEAAEQGGGPAAPAAAPQAAPQPPTASKPPAAAATPPGPQHMVPKAALDAERNRRRTLEAQLLMASGALQVLTKNGQPVPGAPQQGDNGAYPPAAAAAPTPPQQIDALEAEIVTAAEKFDAGEMTMAEFKRLEAGHSRQIASLREADLLARMPQPTAQQPGIADQAIVQQHLNGLYAKHPYAMGLSEDQAERLAAVAAAEFAAEGQPIGTGPVETMRLQARVAALSDAWGQRWGVKPSHAPAAALVAQPASAANGGAGLSPQAQARANKLALAASHPPDTSSLGAGAVGDDAITEQRIELMTEDELDKLPASILARFQ
jgi:hypothetical protein